MHQYTADLAQTAIQAGHEVHLATSSRYAADRYGPDVCVHTPVSTGGTGFGRAGLQWRQLCATNRSVLDLQPDVVHITGVHLWNLPLLWRLRSAGIRTLHTLHDLDPHPGVQHGSLIRLWNRLVIRSADHLLVHGEVYRRRLLAAGRSPESVTAMPLLHLFGGHRNVEQWEYAPPQPEYGSWALFFGRQEAYKGVQELLKAGRSIAAQRPHPWLVIAGEGGSSVADTKTPPGVEWRSRRIDDDEGSDLFRRCGLVVLPYTGATQSALIAAAYAFSKPVLVSDSGALPEYVTPGETGWVVPAGNVQALAGSLYSALADPDRLAHMGQQGRRWYVEQRRRAAAMMDNMLYQTAGQARRYQTAN
jgi:glycosyltransferase involved in cell wall biosynthesis